MEAPSRHTNVGRWVSVWRRENNYITPTIPATWKLGVMADRHMAKADPHKYTRQSTPQKEKKLLAAGYSPI